MVNVEHAAFDTPFFSCLLHDGSSDVCIGLLGWGFLGGRGDVWSKQFPRAVLYYSRPSGSSLSCASRSGSLLWRSASCAGSVEVTHRLGLYCWLDLTCEMLVDESSIRYLSSPYFDLGILIRRAERARSNDLQLGVTPAATGRLAAPCSTALPQLQPHYCQLTRARIARYFYSPATSSYTVSTPWKLSFSPASQSRGHMCPVYLQSHLERWPP